ncbi:MAG: DNA polymerase III subunit chi [Alphaproteobacteria bacterium]|nr:DNA polymerase III subunit chi [Alphaproteobacteria bacterium]
MQVSFYVLVNTSVEKTLPKLVQKVFDSGARCHIYSTSQTVLETLNDTLWTFSPLAFLPHGSESDPPHTHAKHPIWLAQNTSIVNDASVFIALSPEKLDDLGDKGISRLIYFYAVHAPEASDFKTLQHQIPDALIWQQNSDGGWVKQAPVPS